MIPPTGNGIIVKEITQRHKYRWHVTTDKYVIMFLEKKCSNLFVKYKF